MQHGETSATPDGIDAGDGPAVAAGTVAILLAAGGGSRFRADAAATTDGPGDHKLTALLRGRPVHRWALDSVLAAITPVVVVTGAADLRLDHQQGLVVVHNDRWRDGQAGSLQLGIRAAAGLGATSVVVGLADQPFVTARAWRAVAAGSWPITVATYDGRRANPVRLDASVWPMLPTEGDQGARSLMTLHPDLVGEAPCDGSPADIDTMEDLRQWS